MQKALRSSLRGYILFIVSVMVSVTSVLLVVHTGYTREGWILCGAVLFILFAEVVWILIPQYKEYKRKGFELLDKNACLLDTQEKIDRQHKQIKQLNDHLKAQGEFNKVLVEQSPNAIAMFDKDMCYLAASPRWCSDYGLKQEEIIGKSHYEVFPEIGEDWKDIHRQCLLGSIHKTDSAPFHRANNQLQWIAWDVRPWYKSKNEIGGLLMSTMDITKNKQIETDLLHSNHRLNAILNSGYVSIIGTDKKGTITHFNKGAEQLLGYSATEMVGIMSPVLIHDVEEVENRAKELSEELKKEVRGFDVFVELTKTGDYETRQWTYVRKDGTRFPVQLTVTAIKDEHQQMVGFLGVATDISQLSMAKGELEVLVDKLQFRNSQLLNFAHTLSHNLRSPVANLDTLLQFYDQSEGPEDRELLISKIKTVTQRLNETLGMMMETLKIQEGNNRKVEWVAFKDVLDKVKESLLGQIIETSAVLVSDFKEVEGIVYSKVYLESILLNLVSNALKYRAEDRVPLIQVRSGLLNGKQFLSIQDNGLGINLDKYHAQLFGLNKTFHSHPEAKGVGLYIVKTQVEAMGGGITVRSEVGVGSTFLIEFNKKKQKERTGFANPLG